MKIKLILTAFAIAFASFSFAQSQQEMSSEEIREQAMELTEQMTPYLDLNEAQVERMKGLNMSMIKKKAELQSMDLSAKEMAEKMNEYKVKNNATVKQVLSEEQYDKFREKYGETKPMKKEKSK